MKLNVSWAGFLLDFDSVAIITLINIQYQDFIVPKLLKAHIESEHVARSYSVVVPGYRES